MTKENVTNGNKRNKGELSATLQAALDMVERLGSQGLTAVPVNPTNAMVAAGAKAGGVDPEKALAVYRAMVTAAD